MRMIVTGGAGFIGSALARIAVAHGHDVMIVDKLTYAGNLSSLRDIEGSNYFSFRQADICDDEAMITVLDEFQPDAVFHLAAESHVDRSITGSGAFIETNIVGTFTLLQACAAIGTSCAGRKARALPLPPRLDGRSLWLAWR